MFHTNRPRLTIQCVLATALLISIAGCDSKTPTDNSPPAPPAVPRTESKDDATSETTGHPQGIESAVLKKEIVDVVVELKQGQKSGAELEELRSSVQQMIDKQTADMREYHTRFLVVTAETEKKLQAGSPIQDAVQRIAAAEKSLVEFDLEISQLDRVLLEQHKAGTLSPVRTELLAHLMVGTWKKAEYALTH